MAATNLPSEETATGATTRTTTRWPVHKAFSGRRFPGADDESDTDADISFTMECLYALPEDAGLQSCKFMKRPQKKKLSSPKTPMMTISSPVAARSRVCPTTLEFASPKLSPVVGLVGRSNITPDCAAAAAQWTEEDCRTPEATTPHYSPKTRRRLRLTFDFAQHEQQEDANESGSREVDEMDDVDDIDFGKRRRTT